MFNYTNADGDLLIPKIIKQAVLLVVLLVLLFGSFGTVSAGNVGVKTRFDRVLGTVQPGLYFKFPFIDHVISMDVQTQKDQTDATAASNDLQNVTATVAINYHVERGDAATIYSQLGADYTDRVISPAIQESIKAVTANYTAEQLVTQREEVRDKILTLLTSKLQTYGVQTDSLNIVNFSFSPQFNAAIEAKVTAQQNALAAQNKLQQVQFEAQQTVASAKAQAEAIQIQTQAIQNGGGQAYVELQSVKVQQSAVDKWNGVLPIQMIPGSSVPFLNLKN